MKTVKTLLPGQAGTKKFVKQYGEDLVCVRYRYDEEKQLSVKTVELIVEKNSLKKDPKKIPGNKIVHVSIDYEEMELRRQVKSVGGKWDKEKKLWELVYKDVVELGLTDRIVN